jgi:hypothetical protein
MIKLSWYGHDFDLPDEVTCQEDGGTDDRPCCKESSNSTP